MEKLIKHKNGQWSLVKDSDEVSDLIKTDLPDKPDLDKKIPGKFSIANTSHIVHHDEGGINSKWDIHLKHDNSVHHAHSIDGESPKWSHNDEPVAAKHARLSHVLEHARNESAPHSKEDHLTVTHHGPSGKLIGRLSSTKNK